MPLSQPAPRHHLHTRKISCNGYRRDDGLWDIEGHLVDTKSYGYLDRDDAEVAPETPIHDMWIRLTVDNKLLIHKSEAKTDSSPYPLCAAVNPDFSQLEGITIGPGWMKKVMQKMGEAHRLHPFGGAAASGCHHRLPDPVRGTPQDHRC